MADMTIPYDLSAERAVLGSCLVEREAILVVRNLVSSEDFYLERHAQIYEAILECLADRVPPDLITVADRLRQHDRLDQIGGRAQLVELHSEATINLIPVHVEHYARIVAQAAQSRRLIEHAGRIMAAAYENRPDLALREAEQRMALERDIVLNNAEGWLQQMDDGRDIWHMQFEPRPFIIEELFPAGITLLHGLPKTRKSWLAMNLCYAVACGGKALGQLQAQQGEALYLNLEMDRELLNERLRVMFPKSAPPSGVKFFHEWPLMDGGLFTRLENYLNARPYTRLIVVDTLVRVLPDSDGREGYRSDARMLEAWTKFNANRGLAIVLIHHSRKAGGGGDPIISLSGSTGYGGSVDSALELLIPDQNNLSQGIINRRGRRLRNDSKLHLSWDVQIGTWTINTKAGQITPERRALIDLIEEHGPLTPQRIAALLDRPAPSIRRLCGEMYQAGQLTNMQGLYGLPECDAA